LPVKAPAETAYRGEFMCESAGTENKVEVEKQSAFVTLCRRWRRSKGGVISGTYGGENDYRIEIAKEAYIKALKSGDPVAIATAKVALLEAEKARVFSSHRKSIGGLSGSLDDTSVKTTGALLVNAIKSNDKEKIKLATDLHESALVTSHKIHVKKASGGIMRRKAVIGTSVDCLTFQMNDDTINTIDVKLRYTSKAQSHRCVQFSKRQLLKLLTNANSEDHSLLSDFPVCLISTVKFENESFIPTHDILKCLNIHVVYHKTLIWDGKSIIDPEVYSPEAAHREVEAEARAEEARAAKIARAEAARAEAVRAEAVRTEAVRTEAVRTEEARAAKIARTEAARAEAAQAAAKIARAEAAKIAKAEAAQRVALARAAETEVVKADVAKAVKADASRAEAIRREVVAAAAAANAVRRQLWLNEEMARLRNDQFHRQEEQQRMFKKDEEDMNKKLEDAARKW
jgi:hypothetical protein